MDTNVQQETLDQPLLDKLRRTVITSKNKQAVLNLAAQIFGAVFEVDVYFLPMNPRYIGVWRNALQDNPRLFTDCNTIHIPEGEIDECP